MMPTWKEVCRVNVTSHVQVFKYVFLSHPPYGKLAQICMSSALKIQMRSHTCPCQSLAPYGKMQPSLNDVNAPDPSSNIASRCVQYPPAPAPLGPFSQIRPPAMLSSRLERPFGLAPAPSLLREAAGLRMWAYVCMLHTLILQSMMVDQSDVCLVVVSIFYYQSVLPMYVPAPSAPTSHLFTI